LKLLQEIAVDKVKQDRAGHVRRWFRNDYFDLFTWQSPEAEVVAFQLCYNTGHNERVLSWKKDLGFLHCRIDDGQSTAFVNMSPIFVSDGSFPGSLVMQRFIRESAHVSEDLRCFVINKVSEYQVKTVQTAGKTPRQNKK
jgi:hypothetical protein